MVLALATREPVATGPGCVELSSTAATIAAAKRSTDPAPATHQNRRPTG